MTTELDLAPDVLDPDPQVEIEVEVGPADFDVDADTVDDLPDRDDRTRNWDMLRQSRDHWKTRAEATEEAARSGVLFAAGFDPESTEGKILLKDIAAGDLEADPAAITAHAFDEYQWSPNVVIYSQGEFIQLAGGQRLAATRGLTMADEPPDLANQIEAAEADGNHRLARQLKTRFVMGGS